MVSYKDTKTNDSPRNDSFLFAPRDTIFFEEIIWLGLENVKQNPLNYLIIF